VSADDEVGPDRVGKLVDERYKLLEVMASGAMGSVYKAERVPVGKLVAVKFLHASFANDSEFQARFERETRVMSKLAHPNCVSVLDFGVWENTPYLVMDHVAGITLRAKMDKGPIPPAEALGIARQIAAGLAHAHDQGVFHRDVKPANIMITEEIGHGDRIRILDFGLARLRGNVGRDATQTNMVVGTPNYMAPEQTVPGGMIDARTDVYAVGVVLFEMVAGERPFTAEDTMQLLGMHRAAPIPRLADRVPEGTELPDGLQELIDKAMAKSPAERFQSAIELADAIDDIIGGKPEPMRKIESVRVKRAVGSAKGATAVGVAPTMVDIDSEKHYDEPTRSRFWRTMIAAMILIGGAVAMAGYLIHRNAEQSDSVLKHDGAVTAMGSNPVPPVDDAPLAMAASDAPGEPPIDAPTAEPIDAVVEPGGSGGSAGSAGSGVGSGAGSDEIEMDPNKAVDLDPGAGSAKAPDEDEAENAPKTPAEAEKHAPATPQLATNLHDAVQLIKDGKRDVALASLQVLHKKSPKSAYIPFLLGNLYFDQRWWSVAMDFYDEAIKKNVAYRSNPVINNNVINMLSSAKTRQRAANFLRGTIGHPAAPYLRNAAVHGANETIRKQAAALARVIR